MVLLNIVIWSHLGGSTEHTTHVYPISDTKSRGMVKGVRQHPFVFQLQINGLDMLFLR